jgi:2-polyprenyl-3-methyl-5-hydroxy-6-metoxy-1,4-benzoquinol methylase
MPEEQFEHGMMTQRSHDEAERQNNIRALRQKVLSKLAAGSREMFYRDIAPRYEKQAGKPLDDYRDIRKEMLKGNYMKFQMGFHRVVQELMWEALVPPVEAQLPDLIKTSKALDQNLGSLELDPTLDIPRYITAVDIHCQPGGFTADHCDGDISAGAIYDRAIHIYNAGGAGMTDMAGRNIADYLDAVFPDLNPTRILDMGCTIGHSTAAYAKRWPDAELHAIDVGAALLRYAHARAEALGLAIHFSQQTAEKTRFEDASFDLITSNILAHETSTKAWPAIIRECHRLLKPGGVMIHADLPQLEEVDPYRQFIYTNETYYNNEPFWTKYRTMDLRKVATDAGFLPDNVIRDFSNVKGGHDRARIDAAVEHSRSLGHGAPPGSPLGTAFLVGIKE